MITTCAVTEDQRLLSHTRLISFVCHPSLHNELSMDITLERENQSRARQRTTTAAAANETSEEVGIQCLAWYVTYHMDSSNKSRADVFFLLLHSIVARRRPRDQLEQHSIMPMRTSVSTLPLIPSLRQRARQWNSFRPSEHKRPNSIPPSIRSKYHRSLWQYRQRARLF